MSTRKKRERAPVERPKFDSNTRGVLHEILVTQFLNKEVDVNEREVRRLISCATEAEVAQSYRYAEHAADSLVHLLEDVDRAFWTSKPGDIERITGIPSEQKEDASDIVILGSSGRFTGVSLKVSYKTGHVPISNPGIESTLGGKELLDEHRELIYKYYPDLKLCDNKEQRKEYIHGNPEANTFIRKQNGIVLKAIVGNLCANLNRMDSEEAAEHIRRCVLHARATPMQNLGHGHIRHTTFGKREPKIKMINPALHYEDCLKEHWKLGFALGGNAIKYLKDGKVFAEQRMKFDSQSDPLSIVKSSCKDIGKH